MKSKNNSTKRHYITSTYAIIDDFIFSADKEAIDNGFSLFKTYDVANVYVKGNSYGLVWTR
jgi:hypothetical protein